MCCTTLSVQEATMATTQLTRVIQYEDAASWQLERNAGRKPLRMSWVVVTDNHGRRQLGMQWELAAKK